MAFDGQRLVAVDIGILYGDSWGVPHHRRALKYLNATLRHQLVVCPTVMREIKLSELRAETSERTKTLTHIVRQDLDDSDYFIHSELTDHDEKLISDCAEKFIRDGDGSVLGPGGTKNDARLIIEASHFHCDELITVRAPILDYHRGAVERIMDDCGFRKLEKIFSPKLFGS